MVQIAGSCSFTKAPSPPLFIHVFMTVCVAQMAAHTAGVHPSYKITTRWWLFFLLIRANGSNIGAILRIYLVFAHHIWLLFPVLSKQINSLTLLITPTVDSGVR